MAQDENGAQRLEHPQDRETGATGPSRYGDDYGRIYRAEYDATYGSARQIGISGVQPQMARDDDEEAEKEARRQARDRAVRAEQERMAVDALTADKAERS
jgi:hypothetical protein